MYDLNKAMGKWKYTFEQNEACGHENVQELECHLREQIGVLVESGLSEEEAFLVAESRLGDPDQICKQFAEADPSGLWQRRLFWMAGGVFCWFAIVLCQRAFLAVVDTATLSLGIRSGVELGIVNIVASLSSLLLIALGCKLLNGRQTRSFSLPTFISTRARAVTCVLGLLVAAVLGKLIALAPMVYASRVLPSEDFGTYAMYRTFSGYTVNAVLAIVIAGFFLSQFTRRCKRSITATD
jgi:hypothetical protein